jgi:hypothetical protein
MGLAALIPLITEVLRAFNNLTEGKSPEQRKAEALIAWELVKPIIWPFLPEETRKQVDALMGSPGKS